MSELQRVLAELDDLAEASTVDSRLAEDAARLLREIAADFGRCYGLHHHDCAAITMREEPCSCGLDAARAKWRINP